VPIYLRREHLSDLCGIQVYQVAVTQPAGRVEDAVRPDAGAPAIPRAADRRRRRCARTGAGVAPAAQATAGTTRARAGVTATNSGRGNVPGSAGRSGSALGRRRSQKSRIHTTAFPSASVPRMSTFMPASPDARAPPVSSPPPRPDPT
jgi:hypothetical protein